jgi:hypothetical protein
MTVIKGDLCRTKSLHSTFWLKCSNVLARGSSGELHRQQRVSVKIKQKSKSSHRKGGVLNMVPVK